MTDDKLTGFLNEFETLTKNPEKYLSVQDNEAKKINLLTKNLYDFSKQHEDFKKKTEALSELIISRLDEEQIWQQIELQNNAVYDNVLNKWAYLLANKNKLKFPLKQKRKETKIQSVDEEQEKEEIDNNSCIEEDAMNKKEKKNKKDVNKKKVKKSSIVDDKFFKLHEMNAFLEEVEKEKQESDGEDLDYFDDNSSEDSNNSSYRPHYKDFFDEPEDEMEAGDKKRLHSDDENEDIEVKKVKFLTEDKDEKSDGDDFSNEEESENEIENYKEDDDSDNDRDIEDNTHSDEEINNEEENIFENDDISKMSTKNKSNEEQPSTFEARQERLKSRINALEEAALKKKPWQMMGEITGSNRPQNSLLQEYVEFDVATRPAPILTEKSTMKLEDIIIQRIKDKAWDDVVRKIKPVENELEYKKKLVLNQEKSKLSLAQIYEQDYLQQLQNKAEDLLEKPEIESREHEEIRIMMNNLFIKLDALSNFHFTPKQVSPEFKIVSNLPAITMEEVAPTSTSDGALLAPEEIKAKLKGDLIGKSERTSTDKKRERRQKKLRQKLKHRKLEGKIDAAGGNEKSKNSQKNKISNKLLQKITKSSNVTQMQQSGGKNVMSSTAFFSKLQDESRNKIKKKVFDINKPKLNKKFKSSGKKIR